MKVGKLLCRRLELVGEGGVGVVSLSGVGR